jgi:hypothetical protein
MSAKSETLAKLQSIPDVLPGPPETAPREGYDCPEAVDSLYFLSSTLVASQGGVFYASKMIPMFDTLCPSSYPYSASPRGGLRA